MRDPRSYSDDTLRVLRERAVEARGQGHSVAVIADVLGVHPMTVYRWLGDHASHGPDGLPGDRTGRPVGSGRLLSPEQEREIAATVAEDLPADHEIAAAAWTRRAVRQLIERFYSLEMSERTVGDYLARWGFTCQRAARSDPALNPEEVAAWKTETYPEVQKRAEQEDATIVFADETGCQAKAAPCRGYAPRGTTPRVEIVNSRIKVNVLIRMSTDGALEYATFTENMTGAVWIAYLEEWLDDADGKLIVIADRLPAHDTHEVRAWLARHADQIELVLLPAHAPELNPVEYANQDMKSHVFQRGYPRTMEELRWSVEDFLNTLKNLPHKVANYFRHPEAQYALG